MSKGLASDIQMEIHPVISIIISIIWINECLACYNKHDCYVFTSAETHNRSITTASLEVLQLRNLHLNYYCYIQNTHRRAEIGESLCITMRISLVSLANISRNLFLLFYLSSPLQTEQANWDCISEARFYWKRQTDNQTDELQNYVVLLTKNHGPPGHVCTFTPYTSICLHSLLSFKTAKD